MKLIRSGAAGQETPGVLLEDGVRVDASVFAPDFDERFFAGDGLLELRRWITRDAAHAPRLDPRARLGPPLARPGKIVCIGLNFRDHAAESGIPLPAEPVIFFKSTTALSGPHDDVMIPRGGTKLDWEVELAVVIGRRAAYVPRHESLSLVAGYAVHNDYSERSFQMERGGQWVKGKSADTFAPLGPFMATVDEVPDPQALSMWLAVNGTRVQRSSTSQMIFNVAWLVSYVSEFMTLLPGDIISTGTPAGVGLGMKPDPVYLRPGDIVELGIEGLGTQRQRVVAYSAGPATHARG
jgi:2-keto-4-pentenoate hydratase/2-oxohepta-3-ene-1,7-dioic acid hydratase in catechol pathway